MKNLTSGLKKLVSLSSRIGMRMVHHRWLVRTLTRAEPIIPEAPVVRIRIALDYPIRTRERPPSTPSICPVIQSLAGSIRNDNRLATSSGFPIRKSHLDKEGVKTCLSWLANFHAKFMNVKPDGLWQTGSYWHLETRPDELKEMASGPLKTHASEIDQKLSSCKYQTFVHGDAKVANLRRCGF